MTLGRMKKRSFRLFAVLIAMLFLHIIRIAYWQIARGNEMKEAMSQHQ